MNHDLRHGWIEVITGVMFSGKTEEMIRRVRRAAIAGKRVQIFKSHHDDRYGGLYTVATHDGAVVQARPIDSSAQVMREINSNIDVVAIDEVQFLDNGIVDVVDTLANAGTRVILAGTDLDFRGQPFGCMPHLMAVAEIVDKLHAICVVCGNHASRNQRLIGGQPAPKESPTIWVGGRETYEARCRACHVVPAPHANQPSLL